MIGTHDSAIADQILNSALSLFAQRGYSATSTREIAERSGVTKPMLYYYFESKEGLCKAVFARLFDQFHSRLREVLSLKLDPLAQLVEMVWAHLDCCQENKDFARLFFALYFGRESEISGDELKKYGEAGQEMLQSAVRDLIRSGQARSDCEERLTMSLHGMINIWVIAALKYEEGVQMSRATAQQIVDDLLNGFRPS